MKAAYEILGGERDFASGLLVELLRALRATERGALIAIRSDKAIGDDLEKWCRLTGNALIASGGELDDPERVEGRGVRRWIVRNGEAPREDLGAPLGTRLWLYTNFDCNLKCDYCCVRSSPTASRRELGLARVERIAREAPELGVREIFLTGGEPFLLPDIASLARACAAAAPTTILTNGMLFRGARVSALKELPRDRVTLQISLDSATPELHDLHRGKGSWEKAWHGVELARAEGFRARLAATVSDDAEEAAFAAFLDRENVAREDRVIRRIALRGFAADGVAISRADLVAEVTITADGVYFHPVGAEDEDLRVTRDIFPLRDAFAAVRAAVEHERAFGERLASVFHCA